jgi:tetratricopeptide (TPR) repeat protein
MAGRVAEAEAVLVEALRINPQNPTLLSFYGSVLYRNNKVAAAEDVFRKLITIEDNARNRIDLAELLMAQKRYSEGEGEFRRALEFGPAPDLQIRRAAAFYSLGRDADSEAIIDDLKRDPKTGGYYAAAFMASIDRFEEALAMARRVLPLETRTGFLVALWQIIAEALYYLGYFAESTNAFAEALRIDPSRTDIAEIKSKAEQRALPPRTPVTAQSYAALVRKSALATQPATAAPTLVTTAAPAASTTSTATGTCKGEPYNFMGMDQGYLVPMTNVLGHSLPGYYKRPSGNYAWNLNVDGTGTYTLDSRQQLHGNWFVFADCAGAVKTRQMDGKTVFTIVMKVTQTPLPDTYPPGHMLPQSGVIEGGTLHLAGMLRQ